MNNSHLPSHPNSPYVAPKVGDPKMFPQQVPPPLYNVIPSKNQMATAADPKVLLQHPGLQTMLWAQENHFVDSGVQTSAATNTNATSSIISGHLAAVEEQMEFNAPCTGPLSVHVPPRLRAMNHPGYTSVAYANDMASYNVAYAASLPPGGPTTEFGFQPNFYAPNMVSGMQCQPDEPSFGKINEWAQLLCDEDQVVATTSAELVESYAVCENSIGLDRNMAFLLPAFFKAVEKTKNPQLIRHLAGTFNNLSGHMCGKTAFSELNLLPSLFNLMNITSEPAVIRKIAGTLYNLSNDPNGRWTIYNNGGVQILVQLLEFPNDSVIYHAITTLHNMILYHEHSLHLIRKIGTVPKLIVLLKTKTLSKFLAILVDCLYYLAYGYQPAKDEILNNGSIPELIRILKTQDYEKLMWATSRLMQALSICPNNKKAIIAAGGLQALAPLLHHASHRLVHTILLVIRNMSDAATHIQDDSIDDLVKSILQLVGSSDAEIVLWCTSILANMSCNNTRNKATIYRNGGVRDMLRTMELFHPQRYPKTPPPATVVELLDGALRVLRHVTARHPDASACVTELRSYVSSTETQTGLQLMVDLTHLDKRTAVPLIEPALALLKELSNTPENAPLLLDYGLGRNVVANFLWFSERLKDVRHLNGAAAKQQQMAKDESTFSDIVEACLSVSQVLCKYASFKQGFKHCNFVGALLQILNSAKCDSTQQQALAILAELIGEPEVVYQVEQCGGGLLNRLAELAYSTVESTAKSATKILDTVNYFKNQRQHQQYGLESLSLHEKPPAFTNQQSVDYQIRANDYENVWADPTSNKPTDMDCVWNSFSPAETGDFNFIATGSLELSDIDVYGGAQVNYHSPTTLAAGLASMSSDDVVMPSPSASSQLCGGGGVYYNRL